MIKAALLIVPLFAITVAGCAGEGGSRPDSGAANKRASLSSSVLRDCSESIDAQRRLESCSKVLQATDLSSKERAQILTLRASATLQLQKGDEAIADLDKALEVDPNHVWAHIYRGLAAMAVGDHTRALSAFDTALEIDPNHAEAHSDRGWLLVLMGESERAIADLDASIALNPKRAEPYYWRAAANAELGNRAEAERDLAAVAAIDPGMIKRRGNPLGASFAVEIENQGGQPFTITVSPIDVLAVQCPQAGGWPVPRNDADWEGLIAASRQWRSYSKDVPCDRFTLYVYEQYLASVYSDESEVKRRVALMDQKVFGTSP